MSKLYVGNLPADVNEGTLRQLFQDHGLACTTVLVKRGGYAFVDCPDQSTADRAIDKLNGFNFMGSSLVVEPSVAAGGTKKSANTRILVSNVPVHVRTEDFEAFLTTFGTVQQTEKFVPKDAASPTHTYQVTFETIEQAQQALGEINGCEYENSTLRAEPAIERRSRSRSARPSVPFSGMPGTARQMDFPLRILVQSDMVGAIIGRQGSTIRQITQQTRARVDVHRKDNVGSLEKAITIYGNPENCTNACKKILDVMQQEATNTNKGEVSLKILAHNNLIGRIIGKGGNTIKRIMQETDTKITVSSINDINSFNLERIITIKGSIENMSKAEAMISAKLKQSYESDLQAMAPQSLMFPGLHPMAMMSTLGVGFPRGAGFSGIYGSGPAPYPPVYPPAIPAQPSTQQDSAGENPTFPLQALAYSDEEAGIFKETTFLYIPNTAVGAIIGKKGTHIRNIIRFSGASVKISPLEQDKPAEQQTERKVTIVGTPEAQWKAQYLVFEKMREEGFVAGSEDVRLTVEILVPSSQVGRIIGKGGQNVRELQRVTGSIIKLPEQGAASGEETTVQIVGPFFSVQSAQRRIRAMVNQAQPAGTRVRGQGPPPPPPPPQVPPPQGPPSQPPRRPEQQ